MGKDNIFFNQLSPLEKMQMYVSRIRPVLDTDALFADGSERYRRYVRTRKGWKVQLRFRTARENALDVTLVTDTMRVPMHKASSDKLFDYYETVVSYPECGTRYHFEAASGKTRALYNKRGAFSAPWHYYDFVFRPQDDTPDWAKGAVFYQIFVDRFRNGDSSNDIVDGEYSYLHQRAWLEPDWDSPPRENDVCHFYGGDLEGVLEKLDYLQDLGVEAIYFNPLFVSPSNHKYDVQDYDHIDPHYAKILVDGGDVLGWNDEDNTHAARYITRVTSSENLEAGNAFFADFIEQAHKRGIRVILDGVFNHCGSFNKWMDRERIYEGQPGYAPGAFISGKSPYRGFFEFSSSKWPYNADYEGWWNHATLPKLNYEESETLCEYILEIARKWVSPPYNADGWRLDVAADLGHTRQFNHEFWKRFRKAVKEANPQALILAENYTDPAEWLDGDEWDSVMNYQAFMEPVTWFLTGMEKHSDEYRKDLHGNYEAFISAMTHHMSRFHYNSLLCAMNELSNHDHSRFLTRTNGTPGRLSTSGPEAASQGIDPAVMREAVLIQMTWPGAPTVYYGDEAGVCGWTDPDNRRTYPWGHEDQQMIAFHREAIHIHNRSTALRTGSLKMLCGGEGYLAYGRFNDKERYVTVINNGEKAHDFRIPVRQVGIASGRKMERLLLSLQEDYVKEREVYEVADGHLSITLPPKAGAILREIRRDYHWKGTVEGERTKQ